MVRIWLLGTVLLSGIVTICDGASLPDATPIAHYPLQSDGLDATGMNDPMILTNAPFQDGGVYCNGVYPTQPGGYEVRSPYLQSLNFDSFAVSAEFRIDQYPPPEAPFRPIIICGTSYRYLGAEVHPDGTISLLYNNGNRQSSDKLISLDTWHQLVLTYDSPTHTGRVFLDNVLASSADYVLEHGDDSDVGTLNPSNGTAFLGLVREIVAYDSAYDPTPVGAASWGKVKAIFR